MTLNRARFDKLPPAAQGLIFIAFSCPFFIPFVIAGDLPRGTLAWVFSTALLGALYARGEKRIHRIAATSTAILVAFHILLVVLNPLRNVHLLGGLVVPILLVDYCIDYAFLWLVSKALDTSGV